MSKPERIFTDLQRLRKKISPCMQRMLDRIKSGEKISYRDLGYLELGTINALMNRCLVTRDTNEEYYRLSSLTDELLQKYVDSENARQ